jgi:hypothetical protein
MSTACLFESGAVCIMKIDFDVLFLTRSVEDSPRRGRESAEYRILFSRNWLVVKSASIGFSVGSIGRKRSAEHFSARDFPT